MTTWIRRHVVVVVSVALAVASCLLVPPSAEYASYLQVRTLVALYCTLAVVGALQRLGFVEHLAEHLVRRCRSRRGVVLALVLMTAGGALLFTNDMALVTLLPLSYLVLRAIDGLDHLAYVFVLQAAAANLGGMLTPFGSPQNLYLYSYYELSLGELVRTMGPPFALAMVLMVLLVLRIPNGPVPDHPVGAPQRRGPVVLYLALFAVSIALVLRVLPVWAGLVVPLVLLVTDRTALRRLDHGLLITLVAFFVVAGNLERTPAVESAVSALLRDDVMVWSALSSQVLSNVPVAVLFSRFTDDVEGLLLGVNIGGVGTLVASLASLIALRAYQQVRPGDTWTFVRTFTAVNVGLLVALLGVVQAAITLR